MMLEYFSLVLVSLFIYNTAGFALHEHCYTNEDCGTIDTYCKNQTCVCRENFAVWYDSCVQLASPRLKCLKRHDCQIVLGVKSMCTRHSLCSCKAFHHLHHGQCVKNRDLHDICENDHQCYCGEDCEDKIACMGGNCTCKPGHKLYRSRRCILDPDNPHYPSSSAQLYHPIELWTAVATIIELLLLKIM